MISKYIFLKNTLDARPSCAPSHWDENFIIYYMTERMRNQTDARFGEVCDRVGKLDQQAMGQYPVYHLNQGKFEIC